jgi:hypothetical protein
MSAPKANLETVLELWEKLGPREKMVLQTFGMRLWAGQRKYGQLSVDKKDWAYEAIVVALDASVYLTAMLSDKVDKAFQAMVPDAEKEVINRFTISGCLEPQIYIPQPDRKWIQDAAEASYAAAFREECGAV